MPLTAFKMEIYWNWQYSHGSNLSLFSMFGKLILMNCAESWFGARWQLKFWGEIASVGLQPMISVVIDHMLIMFTVNCWKTFWNMRVTVFDCSKRRLLIDPLVQAASRLLIYYQACSRSPHLRSCNQQMFDSFAWEACLIDYQIAGH